MSNPSTVSADSQSRPQRLLRAVLRPGLMLMERLRLPGKLAMMSASLALPMVLLMVMAAQSMWQDRRVAVVEQDGVTVSELILPVALHTYRLRDLSLRALDGDKASSAQLDDESRALAAAMKAMDDRLGAGLGYPMLDQWAPVREKLQALVDGKYPREAAAAARQQGQTADALVQLQLINAERSELILDPEARAYHLMDVLVNSSLPLLDAVARTRGLGGALLAHSGEPDAGQKAELLGQARLVVRGVSEIQGKFAALERAGGQTPGSWPQAALKLQELARDAQSAFGDGATGAALNFGDQGQASLAQLSAVCGDTYRRLTHELQDRQRAIERRLLLAISAFLLGLTMLGYLVLVFIINVRRSLRGLRDGTQAIAAGDLSHRVQLRGHDELAEIGNVVDAMGYRLSTMVAEIRSSAAMVNQTGQQVSEGSARLANRTDEQASSLRQAVSAIKELSSATASNAHAARELDVLTGKLAQQGVDSAEAMNDTVQAMQQMQEASARVAAVVSVIDDVAFQTGMLSLNAAIEAAKAGEAGRGFAVVASEVRQLAQRCADSTEEIRRLIGEANTQAEISSEKLGRMTGSLTSIVDGVNEVSAQLCLIAASSTEQSEGLNAITQTVGNLDEITRDNAALVEESSTASHALVSRADKLRDAVVSMRLRQGSADEAMALVQRARAHVAAVGRAAAMQDFQDPNGDFVDRDLYIFTLDHSGIFGVVGTNRDLAGKPVMAVPGLGQEFVDDTWNAANAGGGWVQYRMIHPVTGSVMNKESFCEALDDEHLLGCGIYRDIDAAQDASVPRAAAWGRDREVAVAPA